jgi:hypothetical protein
MKITRYHVGASLFCLVAGFGLIHLANTAGTAEDSSKSSEVRSESNPGVGTVMMWWGSRDAIPSGWELCDGQSTKTAGATLSGKKPDLVDRFPKGALASRKNINDLAQAVGGNNNMPALQISKIAGLKISEDGAHTHSPLEQAAGVSDSIDQADNEESSDVALARSKSSGKKAKSDDTDSKAISEGNHSHKLSGFVGTENGVNADGADKTGANQPAYSELFFIIRAK